MNDELEVAETLNSRYINIVETTCRQPPDGIPLQIIKLSADVIDKHLTNINTDLECSCFSENA